MGQPPVNRSSWSLSLTIWGIATSPVVPLKRDCGKCPGSEASSVLPVFNGREPEFSSMVFQNAASGRLPDWFQLPPDLSLVLHLLMHWKSGRQSCTEVDLFSGDGV